MGAGSSVPVSPMSLLCFDVVNHLYLLGNDYHRYIDKIIDNGIGGELLSRITSPDEFDNLLNHIGIVDQSHKDALYFHFLQLGIINSPHPIQQRSKEEVIVIKSNGLILSNLYSSLSGLVATIESDTRSEKRCEVLKTNVDIDTANFQKSNHQYDSNQYIPVVLENENNCGYLFQLVSEVSVNNDTFNNDYDQNADKFHLPNYCHYNLEFMKQTSNNELVTINYNSLNSNDNFEVIEKFGHVYPIENEMTEASQLANNASQQAESYSQLAFIAKDNALQAVEKAKTCAERSNLIVPPAKRTINYPSGTLLSTIYTI